jgi:sugar/nucleoside kinase (ribokinase family)
VLHQLRSDRLDVAARKRPVQQAANLGHGGSLCHEPAARTVEAAARWAARVAAAVVERPGAMDSLPTREEVL